MPPYRPRSPVAPARSSPGCSSRGEVCCCRPGSRSRWFRWHTDLAASTEDMAAATEPDQIPASAGIPGQRQTWLLWYPTPNQMRLRYPLHSTAMRWRPLGRANRTPAMIRKTRFSLRSSTRSHRENHRSCPSRSPPCRGHGCRPQCAIASAAFGTLYQFDAQGRIIPTAEAVVTPEGVRLVAGKPPHVHSPPERRAGDGQPAAAEPAETAAAPVFADPALAGARPRPRPDTFPRPPRRQVTTRA